jgi:hypothetical protein
MSSHDSGATKHDTAASHVWQPLLEHPEQVSLPLPRQAKPVTRSVKRVPRASDKIQSQVTSKVLVIFPLSPPPHLSVCWTKGFPLLRNFKDQQLGVWKGFLGRGWCCRAFWHPSVTAEQKASYALAQLQLQSQTGRNRRGLGVEGRWKLKLHNLTGSFKTVPSREPRLHRGRRWGWKGNSGSAHPAWMLVRLCGRSSCHLRVISGCPHMLV